VVAEYILDFRYGTIHTATMDSNKDNRGLLVLGFDEGL